MKTNDITKLFALFHARYGHRWVSAYPDEALIRLAVKVWTDELKDFPPEWIQRGVKNWRGNWPPSLPEFQKACVPQPDALGIDVHQMAMHKASNGDPYNYRRLPADHAKRLYDKARASIEEQYMTDCITDPYKMAQKQLTNDG